MAKSVITTAARHCNQLLDLLLRLADHPTEPGRREVVEQLARLDCLQDYLADPQTQDLVARADQAELMHYLGHRIRGELVIILQAAQE
jgi:hypothetical protein